MQGQPKQSAYYSKRDEEIMLSDEEMGTFKIEQIIENKIKIASRNLKILEEQEEDSLNF